MGLNEYNIDAILQLFMFLSSPCVAEIIQCQIAKCNQIVSVGNAGIFQCWQCPLSCIVFDQLDLCLWTIVENMQWLQFQILANDLRQCRVSDVHQSWLGKKVHMTHEELLICSLSYGCYCTLPF